MIVTIGIILLLLVGVFNGMRQGAVKYILKFVGLIVVWLIAYMYYKPLAQHLKFITFDVSKESALSFLNSEIVFYNVIAFAIIFVVSSIVVKIIINLLNSVTRLPILKQLNGLIGAVLGFVIFYAVIFMVMNFLLLFSSETIQTAYQSSQLAQWMMTETPLLSDYFYHWMIQYK